MGYEHEVDEDQTGADHDRIPPPPPPPPPPRPLDVGQKVDIIAGAVADLEGRVTQMAEELASIGPKLNELLDRHPAGLGAASETTAAVASDVATTALEPVHTGLAALTASVEQVATTLAQLDDKTDDRLAAVRDAAMTPVADLQAILTARNERVDARLGELATAIEALRADVSDDGRAALLDAVEELGASLQTLTARAGHSDVRPLTEQVGELVGAVQSVTWQLPELADQIAALRGETAGRLDTVEPADDELVGAVADRVETAMAGLLRLVDERLAALRLAASAAGPAAQPPTSSLGGFEAGAVMGAAQAAWNRLEQRLDREFDDLSRQLQAMAALIEHAAESAEAAANRPVVTGDQLRHAASTVKESVLRASRARRDRRGGPRGLNPGS